MKSLSHWNLVSVSTQYFSEKRISNFIFEIFLTILLKTLLKDKKILKPYLRDTRIENVEKLDHIIFVKFLTDFEQILWYWKFLWRATSFCPPFWFFQAHRPWKFYAIKPLVLIKFETFWDLNINFVNMIRKF